MAFFFVIIFAVFVVDATVDKTKVIQAEKKIINVETSKIVKKKTKPR